MRTATSSRWRARRSPVTPPRSSCSASELPRRGAAPVGSRAASRACSPGGWAGTARGARLGGGRGLRHRATTSAASTRPARCPRWWRELFEQRLDRSRPLWRMDLVDLEAGALGAGVAHPSRAGRRPDLHAAGRRGAVGLAARAAARAHAPRTTSAAAPTWPGSCGASSCRAPARSPFDGSIGRAAAGRLRVGPAAARCTTRRRTLAGATLNDAVLVGDRGGAAPLDRGPPRAARGRCGRGCR